MPDPILCTETVNPNYTIGTFQLFVQPEGGSERDMGNIQTGSFQFTPNVVEHREGITNSLDALFKIGSDYIINATGDEVTADNFQILLNEDAVIEAGGCKIPLSGDRCVKTYGVRLVHAFPCQDKTLTITFWRAAILADVTFNFDPTANASFPFAIRSLSCASQHPTEPFGKIFITEPCPSS
jgi:hypothetical protein